MQYFTFTLQIPVADDLADSKAYAVEFLHDVFVDATSFKRMMLIHHLAAGKSKDDPYYVATEDEIGIIEGIKKSISLKMEH